MPPARLSECCGNGLLKAKQVMKGESFWHVIEVQSADNAVEKT